MATKSLLSALSSARTAMESTSRTVLESRKRSEVRAALSSGLSAVEELRAAIPPKSKTHATLRKAAQAVQHTFSGLLDGVNNPEISLREVRAENRAARKTTYARLNSVELEAEIPEPAADEPRAPMVVRAGVVHGADFKDALEVLRDHLSAAQPQTPPTSDEPTQLKRSLDSHYRIDEARLKADMKTMDAQRANIPKIIPAGRNFLITSLPIIPVFKHDPTKKLRNDYSIQTNFSAVPQLKKLAVPHIMILDYVVLFSQNILCVRADAVEQFLAQQKAELDARNKEIRKAHQVKRRKLIKLHGPDADDELEELGKAPTKKVSIDRAMLDGKQGQMSTRKSYDIRLVDYARGVVETINEKLDREFVLVSETPIRNPENKNILMFWIMPRNTLTKLRSSGWSDLQEWRLPW